MDAEDSGRVDFLPEFPILRRFRPGRRAIQTFVIPSLKMRPSGA
jgi:hypothetical protein